MPNQSIAEKNLVARYASGAADQDELNTSIADAWRAALSDPKERKEIAALLDAQESELDPDNPPFEAEVRGAGTFGAEILIALGKGVAIGIATAVGKGVGEHVGKRAMDSFRELWSRYICRRVSPPGSGRLGQEKQDVEQR